VRVRSADNRLPHKRTSLSINIIVLWLHYTHSHALFWYVQACRATGMSELTSRLPLQCRVSTSIRKPDMVLWYYY
jgi:hypothetical protein